MRTLYCFFCAVAGLAKTAVTTAVKVVEVPFKVVGAL